MHIHIHIHIYMTFLSKMKQTNSTSDNFETSKECGSFALYAPSAGNPFACNALNVLANTSQRSFQFNSLRSEQKQRIKFRKNNDNWPSLYVKIK